MSELLGSKRRQVTVARGTSSRRKLIEVEGLDDAVVHARLAAQLPDTESKDGTEADGE